MKRLFGAPLQRGKCPRKQLWWVFVCFLASRPSVRCDDQYLPLTCHVERELELQPGVSEPSMKSGNMICLSHCTTVKQLYICAVSLRISFDKMLHLNCCAFSGCHRKAKVLYFTLTFLNVPPLYRWSLLLRPTRIVCWNMQVKNSHQGRH